LFFEGGEERGGGLKRISQRKRSAKDHLCVKRVRRDLLPKMRGVDIETNSPNENLEKKGTVSLAILE